jgi:pyrroline-5-carboxylate reductase
VTAAAIAFIGAGNMTRSLIGGLIADGYPAAAIWAADPNAEQRASLAARFAVNVTPDNREAVGHARIVVFAVKPQVLHAVAAEVAATARPQKPLVISIAAGVRTSDLGPWLGGGLSVVRAMPNTPALVQSGATALCAGAGVSADQRDTAESIMRAVGLTIWVENEAQMDAVTAVSGSGPAYFFLVMEALQAAAEKLGLASDTARLLTLQTAFGAAKMALESPNEPAALRASVTSPGGTTERALEALEAGHIRELFESALMAAQRRAVELGDLMGKG